MIKCNVYYPIFNLNCTVHLSFRSLKPSPRPIFLSGYFARNIFNLMLSATYVLLYFNEKKFFFTFLSLLPSEKNNSLRIRKILGIISEFAAKSRGELYPNFYSRFCFPGSCEFANRILKKKSDIIRRTSSLRLRRQRCTESIQ